MRVADRHRRHVRWGTGHSDRRDHARRVHPVHRNGDALRGRRLRPDVRVQLHRGRRSTTRRLRRHNTTQHSVRLAPDARPPAGDTRHTSIIESRLYEQRGPGSSPPGGRAAAPTPAIRTDKRSLRTAPHIEYHIRQVFPGQTYVQLAIQHVRHWAAGMATASRSRRRTDAARHRPTRRPSPPRRLWRRRDGRGRQCVAPSKNSSSSRDETGHHNRPPPRTARPSKHPKDTREARARRTAARWTLGSRFKTVAVTGHRTRRRTPRTRRPPPPNQPVQLPFTLAGSAETTSEAPEAPRIRASPILRAASVLFPPLGMARRSDCGGMKARWLDIATTHFSRRPEIPGTPTSIANAVALAPIISTC